jgi:hypothetical protein
MEAISSWEKQRNERSCKTVVEWEELMAKYKQEEPLAVAETVN